MHVCVHVCVHTVWMQAKMHPFLSVVWARVVQNYALHKTNVHTSVMFCVCEDS